MWKRVYLVILFLSDPIRSDHVIDRVLQSLERNLDYIFQNYGSVNVDCLFGVVLGGEILHESSVGSGPYRDKIRGLEEKIRLIYSKTVPVVRRQPNWDLFTKYIVVPELWSKPIKYKVAQFRTAYPKESRAEAIFTEDASVNYTGESLSDSCLTTVINSTLELKPQSNCRLGSVCEKYLEKLNSGVGYYLTHKLLLLQVARVRRCKMHPRVLSASVKKVCHTIYEEAISVDYYLGIGTAFDLVLEEIMLCGYEGYADFLKRDWLEQILQMQYGPGCFPAIEETREKRETNVWMNGCADHTTGLAAGVLSLYLNYLVKNSETISLIPGWE